MRRAPDEGALFFALAFGTPSKSCFNKTEFHCITNIYFIADII